MKLTKSKEDIIESVYYGGTNMDESKDMNLHSAVFAFVDKLILSRLGLQTIRA